MDAPVSFMENRGGLIDTAEHRSVPPSVAGQRWSSGEEAGLCL